MTTANPVQLEEGTTIFGVTSNHYVIHITITKINKVNEPKGSGYSIVEVAASNPSIDFEKRQVELRFNDLLLIDGEINKQAVFTDEREATSFALKNLQKDEEALQRKVDALQQRKNALLA
jgi:hypothetical protein